MSKTVVSDVTCARARFSGNVENIYVSTTSVASDSDLNYLESRLSGRIEELKRRVTELETKNRILEGKLEESLTNLSTDYQNLSEQLISDIKAAINSGNKDLCKILNIEADIVEECEDDQSEEQSPTEKEDTLERKKKGFFHSLFRF